MYYKLKFFSIIMIAIALTCSCNRETPGDTMGKAEEHNDAKFTDKASEQDAQYVVDAYSGSLVEINLAQRAKDLATSDDVKNLASTLLADHQAMNENLRALADKKQISIPTDLSSDQSALINSICAKTGKDFDVAFTSQLIAAHKDAIQLYENAAKNESDSEIRNYFISNLSMIRGHLDMAMDESDKLNNK